MTSLLWSRNEVLQLILPAFGQLNRGLSTNNVFDVIKSLYQFQNYDHKISFDRWLLVAKSVLKWNDSCIKV